MLKLAILSLLVVAGATTAPARAQGRTDYLNFEAPQVKPITVANVNGSHFLLVCNTPDNSVEVYDISDPTKREHPIFVTRIPVGLEPVSVVYHTFNITPGGQNMMYTVNWLGDSVTYVELKNTGGSFSYNVLQELRVTDPNAFHNDPNLRCDDEPMHLAVLDRPDFRIILVSKRTASSYAQFNALPDGSGQVGSCFANGANIIMTNTGRFPLSTTPTGSSAIKEPHAILRRPTTDQVWVLGHQGGGSKLNPPLVAAGHDVGTATPDDFPLFNLDLWGIDYSGSCTPPNTTPSTVGFLSADGTTAIGTTNFNMSFNADGSALYVVGTDALNDKIGNTTLKQAATGFVRTLLYRVKMSSLSPFFRDLNTTNGSTPVPPEKSLAHATDVAVHRQGTTDYVCLVAFNSDRFAVVSVPDSQGETPASWEVKLLDIDPLNDRDPADPSSTGLAGPRGLALLDPVIDSSAADVRVYALNRIDHSVVVIDPKLGTTNTPVKTDQFLLRLDPVLPYIRNGQSFLYSAAFSLSKFVSCASCHVDARSDQLQWSLTSEPGPQPIPPTLPSGPGGATTLEIASDGYDPDGDDVIEEDLNFDGTDYANFVNSGFPHSGTVGVDPENAKGPMVTQSLQGLVNFEVGGDLFQDDGDDGQVGTNEDNVLDDLVSNAPYHWRGDKEGFRHFNEAFANLQGMTDITDPMIADPHGGLTTQQMKNYEEFINSVHYPPNPMQPETRVYSGTLGNPTGTNGTEALAGLKLFHTQPLDSPNVDVCAGRACVQCHALPEGSNNRVTCGLRGTDTSHFVPGVVFSEVAQPLETASLRGLMQKEARLELSSSFPQTLGEIVTGDLGMGSDGMFGQSRNEFVGGGFATTNAIRSRIIRYLREFDHGVAPIVGRSVVRVGAQTEPSLATLEGEAQKANCSLSVYLRTPSGGGFEERGYWYKFNGTSEHLYKQHGSSSEITSAALIDLADASGSILIVRAVPLGSERRVAAVTGATKGVGELPYPGDYPAPGSVSIVGTAPNSANDILRDIDAITPGEQRLRQNWAPLSEVNISGVAPFTWSGQNGGDPPAAVVEPLSLRVTRAFQIALASQGVGVINAHDAPRRLQVTGSQLFQGAMIRLAIPDIAPASSKFLILPVYPTSQVHGGSRVWETAVEFDPLSIYMLMLGGPADTDVRHVLQEQDSGGIPQPGASATTLSAFAGSISGVSYALDAQNAGGATWTSQPAAVINYLKVP